MLKFWSTEVAAAWSGVPACDARMVQVPACSAWPPVPSLLTLQVAVWLAKVTGLPELPPVAVAVNPSPTNLPLAAAQRVLGWVAWRMLEFESAEVVWA